MQRTAGGHRRLPLGHVLQFLRSSGQTLVRPEVLGLPSAAGHGEVVLARSMEQLVVALEHGDEETSRRLIVDLFLSRRKVPEICDEVLAPAMYRIGADWECGKVDVYQERRACGIVERILHELRSFFPVRDVARLTAIGAAPAGDPYRLATMMVEMTLREAGWAADSLGSDLPFPSLAAAVVDLRPKLFWLSVSSMADEAAFLSGYAQLFEAASSVGTMVAVGGVALTTQRREQMRYTVYCDKLHHLANFIDSIFAESQNGHGPAAGANGSSVAGTTSLASAPAVANTTSVAGTTVTTTVISTAPSDHSRN